MNPFTFELMGRTIRVEFKGSEYFNDHGDEFGCWLPNQNLIYINIDQSEDQREHTFLHEFLHAMTECTGHRKISADEDTIDMWASLIQQLNKSRKPLNQYDSPRKT